MSSGIYTIEIGLNYYIGQTISFSERERNHLSTLRRGCHDNDRMQKAFDKHREFRFSVLARCPESYLSRLESHFVSRHISNPRCMNLQEVRPDGSYRQSAATRRKLSLARRGEGNQFYGRSHTAAARARMSKAKKGKPLGSPSPETRRKLSIALMGNTNGVGARDYEPPNRQACEITAPCGAITWYPSVTHAAEAIDMNPSDLSNRLNGKRPWPKTKRSQHYGWSGRLV